MKVHARVSLQSSLDGRVRWFRDLTDNAIRRDAFASVGELIDAITAYTNAWNRQPTAYVWRKTAQQILDKVARGRAMWGALALARKIAGSFGIGAAMAESTLFDVCPSPG